MSGVQSIQRAFTLLRALAVGPAGVTDLAEKSELPKSTVARLLNALETEGAVEQVEVGGEYRLGEGLVDLAGASAPGRNLIAAARPHLMELTEATGETSGIAIMEGTEVLYLDNMESEEEVQVRGWTGETVPASVVPSGLVMLAALPDSDIDEYLSKPLTRSTDNSMTNPEQLLGRLKTVRSDGYSWAYAEFDDSINSVAAPVRDGEGQVIAAVHVHGPAFRFPEKDQADTITSLVTSVAENLSAQIS